MEVNLFKPTSHVLRGKSQRPVNARPRRVARRLPYSLSQGNITHPGHSICQKGNSPSGRILECGLVQKSSGAQCRNRVVKRIHRDCANMSKKKIARFLSGNSRSPLSYNHRQDIIRRLERETNIASHHEPFAGRRRSFIASTARPRSTELIRAWFEVKP